MHHVDHADGHILRWVWSGLVLCCALLCSALLFVFCCFVLFCFVFTNFNIRLAQVNKLFFFVKACEVIGNIVIESRVIKHI